MSLRKGARQNSPLAAVASQSAHDTRGGQTLIDVPGQDRAAGHLRYFFIFSMIKIDFLHFLSS